MGMLPPVIATLLADTKEFNAKMDESTAKMDAFGRSAKANSEKFSGFMSKASTAVLGAAVVVGVAAVKMAGDFQMSTTQLVTGAGEAQKNLEMVRKGILNLAGTVGQTPIELSKGMYLIESAGFHGAQGLQVLKAAAEGASVGGAQMATVAGAVTTVLHDYNLKASHATSVTSGLVTAVSLGKTTMQDLGASLGKVMPVAATYGISIGQVAGAMAVMTSSGLSARFAATNLKTAIASMEAPSKTSLKAFGALGLSAAKFHSILVDPHQGLGPAISYINSGLDKLNPKSLNFAEAEKAIFGNITAASTAMMLGGTHASEYAANISKINQALGTNGTEVKGFSQVQKDFNFKLDQLKGIGSSLMIKLGNILLPKAVDVAKWAMSVTSAFQNSASLRSGFAKAIEGALAIAAGTKAGMLGGAIAAAFGADAASVALAGPIGAAIGIAILGIVKATGTQNWSNLITGHGVGRKKAGENILGNFWNSNVATGESLIKLVLGGWMHPGSVVGKQQIPNWLTYHETTPSSYYKNKYGGGSILPSGGGQKTVTVNNRRKFGH